MRYTMTVEGNIGLPRFTINYGETDSKTAAISAAERWARTLNETTPWFQSIWVYGDDKLVCIISFAEPAVVYFWSEPSP